ncbi:MAG: hydantoinase [Candidatus Marinimicrobia bacterium]|nr:hydantoinase [Candidatus Neomarinimicrobiota bacterium]
MRKIKIGIDVGGTFTHAVAVDISDYSLCGKTCVPTTHKAKEGVAAGVVQSMRELIKNTGIKPNEVVMIAHSTTQATNALLEGDVASVGIVLLGKGTEGSLGFRQIANDNIVLAPGKTLTAYTEYIDLKNELSEKLITDTIDKLKFRGADVIVASEVYGVDDPGNERKVAEIARKKGFMASSASDISQLYGLRVRTRTAVINAAMMPKMLETANMTEKAVRESGIDAPLMIMRSDGGIMDINEMRKRPILTMLSGPAAGVAAALMYARVSDGIFLEVGGTSTDISVIKNGKPQIKSAQIGGNRLFLRALDVRTLGIAGGSTPRIQGGKIIDVGPRSAHIADLRYPSFDHDHDFSNIKLDTIQPRPDDPNDYLAIHPLNGKADFTLTPTEASHFMEYCGDANADTVNKEAIKQVFASVADKLETSADSLARNILEISSNKIKPTIKQLTREYKLDHDLIRFVGGGGGAPAIVPAAAKSMNLPYLIAENTDVISAIGAALGIIRDSVEKTVMSPTSEDIIALRQEAIASVQAMGADPDTIEASVEVDAKNNRVIATATGSGEMRTKDLKIKKLTPEEILEIAAVSLRSDSDNCDIIAETDGLYLIGNKIYKKRLLSSSSTYKLHIRVLDKEGVIKLQLKDAEVRTSSAAQAKTALMNILEDLTSYGDAGALLPGIYVLVGGRIIDMTGLIDEKQLTALLDIELQHIPADQVIVVIGVKK